MNGSVGTEGRPIRLGLSARLLLLTVFFVMLSELLIFAPSVSRFRKVYLEEHIAIAHLASQTLEVNPDALISRQLERALLSHADAYGIVLHYPDQRALMLSEDMPRRVDVTFDIGSKSFMMWLKDAVMAFVQKDNRVMRIIGPSPKNPAVTVEVILDEAPMIAAMRAYSARILQLSILISLVTAGLVYISLQWLMVRPMRRITESVIHFRASPEDDSRTIQATDRADEIGLVQRELAVMQNDIRTALKQKSRLATLGAAVAKINHDLRNSLSTAVLVSDRLADIDDPEVKKVTPRLFTAIDRAVKLCSQTLNYVHDTTPPLRWTRLRLSDLVEDVGLNIRTADEGEHAAGWRNDVPRDIEVDGDRDQLFRVLLNLGENAFQVGAKTVRISAEPTGDGARIFVIDDGPGLTDKARKNLFQPFAGSARDGGTGLGLIIAKDILKAHGGEITLADSGTHGTTFVLDLKDRGAPARAAE